MPRTGHDQCSKHIRAPDRRFVSQPLLSQYTSVNKTNFEAQHSRSGYIFVPSCNSLLIERLDSVGDLGLVKPPSEFLLDGPADDDDVVGLFTLPEEPGRWPVLLLLDLGTWMLRALCDEFDPLPPPLPP